MRNKIRKISLIVLLIFVSVRSFSQVSDSIRYVVTLDSFIVTAVRNGFDVDDFIRFVEKDTSFYDAFRNLRKVDYQSRTSVRLFDKQNLGKASYSNIAVQHVEDNCRYLNFGYEASTGDFFDRDADMNYYTARLFSYIFLYRDTICNSVVSTSHQSKSDSKLEERKEQLKTLIFRPGQPVDGIPFIKNKMEIFSEEMRPFYDYRIESRRYSSGTDCYVFIVRRKESADKGKDVVINELVTWFDKKTMQVVSRQYSLSCFSALFEFDVTMDVNLSTINGYRVPGYIKYSGYWDVPAKKAERGNVVIFIW